MPARLLIASLLLHAYLALRLLQGLHDAAMPAWVLVLFSLYLLASAVLMPLALLSRPMPQPRRDCLAWPGFLMMGAFSSLWILTMLRDLALIAGAALPDAVWEQLPAGWLDRFHDGSAIAIPLAAATMSAVG